MSSSWFEPPMSDNLRPLLLGWCNTSWSFIYPIYLSSCICLDGRNPVTHNMIVSQEWLWVVLLLKKNLFNYTIEWMINSFEFIDSLELSIKFWSYKMSENLLFEVRLLRPISTEVRSTKFWDFFRIVTPLNVGIKTKSNEVVGSN